MDLNTYWTPQIKDLHPRKAPKPSSFTDLPLAPTIPEVSLLFEDPSKSEVFPAFPIAPDKSAPNIADISTNAKLETNLNLQGYDAWKQSKVNSIQSSKNTIPTSNSQNSPLSLINTNEISSFGRTEQAPLKNFTERTIPIQLAQPSSVFNNHLSTSHGNASKHPYTNINPPINYLGPSHYLPLGVYPQNPGYSPYHPGNHFMYSQSLAPSTEPQSFSHAFLTHESTRGNFEHPQPIPRPADTGHSCQFSFTRMGAAQAQSSGPPLNIMGKEAQSKNSMKSNLEDVQQSEAPSTPIQLQSSQMATRKKRNPQVEDLYRIVRLQNEQLQLLQNQVQRLLRLPALSADSRSSSHVQKVEEAQASHIPDSIEEGTQTSEMFQQVSVGVMTSLRFSTDVESPEQPDPNFSLPRAELIRGQDPPESPRCSLHIDMHDYGSSSDGEETDSEESDDEGEEHRYKLEERNMQDKPRGEKQAGWTFYNNVLGQINEMLLTPAQQFGPPLAQALAPASTTPEIPAVNVRQATMQQLQHLGVKFSDQETIPKRVMFDSSFPPHLEQPRPRVEKETAELSVHMNNMALKHLTDQQLSELATRNQGLQTPEKAAVVCSSDVTLYNTNLSFATMRYMERYQILPTNKNQPPLETVNEPRRSPFMDVLMPKRPRSKQHGNHHQNGQQFPGRLANPATAGVMGCNEGGGTSKILNITALKQQPKLL